MRTKKWIALIFIMAAVILTACGMSKEARWQEQYDLGMQYLTDGNYEEAIVAFAAAIEIEPNQALAYIGRGDAYIGSGETDENLTAALADYQQAIELDAGNADAYLGMADAYIRRGEFGQAEEILRTGFNATGDERLQDKIEEIESGQIFDSYGNMRMESVYDESGALLWYHVYSYAAHGPEMSVIAYDGNGNEIGRAEIVTDERGNIIQDWNVSYQDGRLGINRYEYDDAGNAVRIDSYNPDGELDEITLREYDADGRVIREDRGLSEEDMSTHVEYEYDGQGNVIREAESYDGGSTLETVYEYDGAGNPTYLAQYHGEGELSWYRTLEYDDMGNVTLVTDYDENGNMTSQTSMEYDAEGNLINETETRYDMD